MEYITDDVLSVLLRLPPGHLDGGGWEGLSLHMGGHTRQPISPEHREACTGLCGAGAVLGDTLVDSLIILADAIYRQCAMSEEELEQGRRWGGGGWGWGWGYAISLVSLMPTWWSKQINGKIYVIIVKKCKSNEWLWKKQCFYASWSKTT